MKKIITLAFLSLGIIILAGCGQQPVQQTQTQSQNESTKTVPPVPQQIELPVE